jgi:hypothetical protein
MSALRVDPEMSSDVKTITLIRNLLDPQCPDRYFGFCQLDALFIALFELLSVPMSDYSLLCWEIAILVQDVWPIAEFQDCIKRSLSLDSLVTHFDESDFRRKAAIARILLLFFSTIPALSTNRFMPFTVF